MTKLTTHVLDVFSGKPGKDIKIVYTGLRPGEKLEEELFFSDESLRKTGHEKLLLSKASKRG